MLEAVRAIDFDDIAPGLQVTVSIGVAGRTPDDTSLDSIIDRADRLFYKAKEQGRDRVVTSSAAQGEP